MVDALDTRDSEEAGEADPPAEVREVEKLSPVQEEVIETPASGTQSPSFAAEVEQRVMKLMMEGLALQKKTGKKFCPEWSAEMKNTLGPYRRWLLSKPEIFSVVPVQDHLLVRLVDDPELPALRKLEAEEAPWSKALMKAWYGYCATVRKEQYDFDTFVEGFLPSVRSVVPASTAAECTQQSEGPMLTSEEGEAKPRRKLVRTSRKQKTGRKVLRGR